LVFNLGLYLGSILPQLGLDLNRVLYLGIFLSLDSFRSPPSTWIDPFYLTQIQFYLLVESVLYKFDVPVYKKVSYPKQISLLVLHILSYPTSFPESLLGRVTPYQFLTWTLTLIFTPDCARFLTRVTTHNLTQVIPERVTQIFT
jgi:hypothetical protein